MLRHLKNVNELILYASVSCLAAFISRIFPAFYFPILILRLGILGYCLYVIAHTEGNKELAIILGGSLFIGLIGGYWDLIEVYLRFNATQIATVLSFVFLVILATLFIMVKRGEGNGTTRQK